MRKEFAKSQGLHIKCTKKFELFIRKLSVFVVISMNYNNYEVIGIQTGQILLEDWPGSTSEEFELIKSLFAFKIHHLRKIFVIPSLVTYLLA